MKKLCLFIVAMITTAFIGCSPGVEITVITPFGSEDGNHDNYMNACKAYEEATGNTVIDKSGIANEEWKKQIQSDFENGLEPDVVFFFTGADASGFVSNGAVVSISEIRSFNPDYASNMKESMMPVSPSDGRQYAVPVNGYWEGLFVNKKVLAACGIEMPSTGYTWEQFLSDCQIIRDKGYIPIACSLNEIPHYWFEFCTFNNGSLYNHALLPENSDDEVGRIWEAGLNDIKTLYDSGFFPEDTNTITDAEANALMTSDKAAFMIDGSWKIGWFQANADDPGNFAVTYAPAKGERRPTDIIGGLSMGYYISKKAWDNPKKREASVRFVMDMTTDELVSTFGALSVTALKNGTEQPEDADPLVISALAMTKGCTGIAPAAQDGLNTAARNALFADVKKIVTGEIAPKQAIDDCLELQYGTQ